MLRRCFIEEECNRILSMTLDMDGKKIVNEQNTDRYEDTEP